MRGWLLILLLAAGPAAAAPKRSAERAAAALVERAVAAYKAEQFLDAGQLFLDAYALAPVPNQLRNAAKAFERGGDAERALRAWRLYASEPGLSGPERAEANAEVQRFEEARRAQAQIEAAEAKQREAEEQAAAAERERRRVEEEAERERLRLAATASAALARTTSTTMPRVQPPPAVLAPGPVEPEPGPWLPWALIGAGAASLLGSGAVLVHAEDRRAELDAALGRRDGAGKVTGISRGDAMDELDGVNGERRLSLGLAGAGATLALTGLVWWLLDD